MIRNRHSTRVCPFNLFSSESVAIDEYIYIIRALYLSYNRAIHSIASGELISVHYLTLFPRSAHVYPNILPISSEIFFFSSLPFT